MQIPDKAFKFDAYNGRNFSKIPQVNIKHIPTSALLNRLLRSDFKGFKSKMLSCNIAARYSDEFMFSFYNIAMDSIRIQLNNSVNRLRIQGK